METNKCSNECKGDGSVKAAYILTQEQIRAVLDGDRTILENTVGMGFVHPFEVPECTNLVLKQQHDGK